MPALRHLSLYDDIDIPEPATLFDKWEDNAPPARHQELEIDRHMDLNYDLFVDLTPDFSQPPSQKRQDRSAWHNMKRMSEEQLKKWRDHYAPRDAAFHKAKLKGKDLVRWKFQRYAKNYLRSVKGVDESLARLRATLEKMGVADNTVVIYSSDQGFYIGDHGWYDKRWMYEESLMMPFIVKWPGVTKPGSRNKDHPKPRLRRDLPRNGWCTHTRRYARCLASTPTQGRKAQGLAQEHLLPLLRVS